MTADRQAAANKQSVTAPVHSAKQPVNHTANSSKKRKFNQTHNPHKYAAERAALPIFAHKQSIIDQLNEHDTVILVGETGSGKTTQIPQYLYEAGFCNHQISSHSSDESNNQSSDESNNQSETKSTDQVAGRSLKVGCTQPRRVAASSVATRVAAERNCRLGDLVGYTVRFDDTTNQSTRIVYITDGMILRETLIDGLLSQYSVICIDEAHERSLNTDTLMAILKDIQAKRKSLSLQKSANQTITPLKLVIMSATLNAQAFSQYFNYAPIIHVSGRQFNVDVFYVSKAEPDLVDATVTTVMQIHMQDSDGAESSTPSKSSVDGDVLCFLPGQEEIETTVKALIDQSEKQSTLNPSLPKLLVLPLYAALPPEQQMRVFQPTPAHTRKVVVSTNIAETSVTLPNIVHVIDSGVTKTRMYDVETNSESLVVVPVSRAEAWQRAGRAGRVKAGFCYRLYTEHMFDTMDDERLPEIARTNLSSTVIQLKALQTKNLFDVDWMTPPSRVHMGRALQSLYSMDALTREGNLSETGSVMSRLPLDPQCSRALILSSRSGFQCSKEMAAIVSMMQVEQVYISPSQLQSTNQSSRTGKERFLHSDGDHIVLLLVFNEYLAQREKLEAAKQSTDQTNKPSNHQSNKQLMNWCRERGVSERGLNKAHQIHTQLIQIITKLKLPILSCLEQQYDQSSNQSNNQAINFSSIRKCLAYAFDTQVARRSHLMPGMFTPLFNASINLHIHPSSILKHRYREFEFLAYTEMVKTSKRYMRTVTRVDAEWVHDIETRRHAINQTATLSDAVIDRLANMTVATEVETKDKQQVKPQQTKQVHKANGPHSNNQQSHGQPNNASKKSKKAKKNDVQAAIEHLKQKKPRVQINV